MAESEPALSRLQNAFNEGNETLRRQALRDCWAEEGRLVVDGEVIATSRAELDGLIARERVDPEFSIRLDGRPQRSAGVEWGRWTVRGLHGQRKSQNLTAHSGEDGLIERLEAMGNDGTEPSSTLSRSVAAAACPPTPGGPLLR